MCAGVHARGAGTCLPPGLRFKSVTWLPREGAWLHMRACEQISPYFPGTGHGVSRFLLRPRFGHLSPGVEYSTPRGNLQSCQDWNAWLLTFDSEDAGPLSKFLSSLKRMVEASELFCCLWLKSVIKLEEVILISSVKLFLKALGGFGLRGPGGKSCTWAQ